jgi:hypothetical protein
MVHGRYSFYIRILVQVIFDSKLDKREIEAKTRPEEGPRAVALFQLVPESLRGRRSHMSCMLTVPR